MNHLIGAYGLFWRKEEVNWTARNWQLLGYRGTNRPGLRVCDFRRTRGVYVLFNDYGAEYAGLARGTEGIGSRLLSHTTDGTKDWDRFCWFGFDDVVDASAQLLRWSEVRLRDAVAEVSSEDAVREFEALLIQLLGVNKQKMQFLRGEKWRQLTYQAGVGDGIVGRVAPRGFKDRDWWKDALVEQSRPRT